jgi:hypothetical protein
MPLLCCSAAPSSPSSCATNCLGGANRPPAKQCEPQSGDIMALWHCSDMLSATIALQHSISLHFRQNGVQWVSDNENRDMFILLKDVHDERKTPVMM